MPSESPGEGMRHKLSAKKKCFDGSIKTLLHVLVVVAGHQACVCVCVCVNGGGDEYIISLNCL
jgi:hypothetical protein